MSVPAGSVFMPDNVTVALLPSGFSAYAGYFNGPPANMDALRERFPNALLISVVVTLIGSLGGRAADAEPGTLGEDQETNFAAVATFLTAYTGTDKPIVYTMASWATALEDYLTANGHARSTYILWTAHYDGLHICGPDVCGYSRGADGTQYATGLNDYSAFLPGTLTATGVTGTVAGVVRLGDSGPAVVTVQQQLNKWAKYCGFPVLVVDGDFGGKTYNAVRLFQAKRDKGLTVDGEVGSQTERWLKYAPSIIKRITGGKSPAVQVPSGTPLLRTGDTGKPVAELQYYLRNSGIPGVRGIAADGTFGTQTYVALRNFQQYAGVSVDGVYGPDTAAKLAKYATG